MNECEECCLHEFEIKNLRMGFYVAAAINDPGLNMETLFALGQRLNELRTRRDEHRKAHDPAA